MPALLDVLRGRIKERELHAVDHVANAARAAASGKPYDMGALEAALAAQKMTIADFEKAIEVARRRSLCLTQFDGLNAAVSRQKKLEAAIQAEEQKLEEYRLAIVAKVRRVWEDLDLAIKSRDAGERARGELLNPANVPGTIGIHYREALVERDAAQEQASTIERDLRDARERLETQTSLAEQTVTEGKKRFEDHNTLAIRQAKIDDYRASVKSIERRVADLEKQLAAAERDLAAAEDHVKKMEPEVLKS